MADLQVGDELLPVVDAVLARIDAELEKQSDLVTTKKKEATNVTARYDADKQRWQELRAASEASKTARASNATPTVVAISPR